jgi:hypothetical protein
MAQLEVPSYSSESLSHSAAKGLLIGEASDLGYRGTGQLYDDACDVGLALVNPRTGNVTRWGLKEEVRCPREGELLGWMFVPTPETVRKQPELRDYQFNLVND